MKTSGPCITPENNKERFFKETSRHMRSKLLDFGFGEFAEPNGADTGNTVINH